MGEAVVWRSWGHPNSAADKEGGKKGRTDGRVAPSVERVDTRAHLGTFIGVYSKAELERVGRSEVEDDRLAMTLVGLNDSPLQGLDKRQLSVEERARRRTFAQGCLRG